MTETELYRPSNGSEGVDFMERFCFRCERDAKFQISQKAEDGCPIVAASFMYQLDDDGYPKEWRYGKDENPTCTAFEPSH